MSSIVLPSGFKVPHAVKLAAVQHKVAMRASSTINEDGSDCLFITTNVKQREQLTMARMAAQNEWIKHNVLILGETGTGKELMARVVGTRHVHNDQGVLVPAPFKAVNAGSITDTLFESLMFGHRKGAYTGADRDHIGALESAGEGTVFIDEVGDLPMSQQVKLLRAIDNRTILPVGFTDERAIKCRFVFATNKNLPRMIKLGTFRADLYYRMAEFVLRTYPLRERTDDVMPIARTILAREGWTPLEPNEVIPPRCYSRGNVRDLRRCLLWRETGYEWSTIVDMLQEEDDMMEANDGNL